MTKVAFIGLGVMGLPMAKNLLARGFDIVGADVVAEVREAFEVAGGMAVAPEDLDLSDRSVIITMLPQGEHVVTVYEQQVLPGAKPGTLLMDSSTIDVETTRLLSNKATAAGMHMIDAPVSGGSPAAGEGKLSFMLGGSDEAVALAMPVLENMGAKIEHFGPSGAGQAAKACHNMICGITAMAVIEGYALADALGLDTAQFHKLCKNAAAQSWTLENRCPIPGVVPEAPASNDYAPGFAARLMAKDLRLAQQASNLTGQPTPFGAEAARAFTEFAESGGGDFDFSAYFRSLRPNGLVRQN